MTVTPPVAADARPIVALRGLTKTFGDQKALDAVGLVLHRGEVTALIGENGSGKSTLIKCLTGVYAPDGRGQLEWASAAGSAGCVVVHQDLGLIPGLTVAENFGVGVGFSTRLGRISWRRQNRRVQQVLDDAGLAIDARTRVEELTLAQQTVVAIARALGAAESEVSLVILDEPTAALPLEERAQVLDTVRSLRERGIAVLYVSHHLDEIAEIGDRVVVLRAGRVAHDLPNRTADGRAAFDPHQLMALMSGELKVRHAGGAVAEEADVALVVSGLETDLLRGVGFRLRHGEVLGLVGAPDSGAGDLCQALAGLVRYRGTVEVADQRLVPGSVTDSVRRGVYLVPGDRRGKGIIGALDVTENIRLASLRRHFLLAPVSRRQERAEVGAAMDAMDIRPRDPRRKVGMLSGGNQQKVVLARALAQRPTVLVLENPTQGVDPAARLQIRAAIQEAAAAGLAVVVSDVDEAEVAAVAHRVLRVDSGHVVDDAVAR
ncbi:ATP-binding cassette domain-containing protein [Streptomyces sp. NPDC047000]|uniref:ATP-binding cassette domain-containing protein n=1 Tax=Streptomyces sp. NPDC047000 TaxID=3155474 RepID=UPI0033F9E9C1